MQKFSKQLPKEDLKKFAKEVGKKLVASDFKHNRVEDPTKISEKQEKKVKSYVREFFERAVEKKKVLDKKKAGKSTSSSFINGANGHANGDSKAIEIDGDGHVEEEIDLTPSPVELEPETPSLTDSDLKRKRDDEEGEGTPGDDTSSSFANVNPDNYKRLKEGLEEGVGLGLSLDGTPPPPPPPPPEEGVPVSSADEDGDVEMEPVEMEIETEEQKELRLQEEDLMRENEEALALEGIGSNGNGDAPANGPANGAVMEGIEVEGSTNLPSR